MNLDGSLSDQILAFLKYVSKTGMLFLFWSSLVLSVIMPLLKLYF